MINLTGTDYEFCHPDLAEDWIKAEATPTEDGNHIGQLIGYIRLPHKMKHPEAYRPVRKKNNMKQTAVDYLKKNLPSLFDNDKSRFYTALFEQAKALERKQIEGAYDVGFENGFDEGRYDNEPKYAGAEQFYDETYNND